MNKSILDLKILKYMPSFIALAEEGSLEAASYRLGLSIPKISKDIKSLEFLLDLSLFDRKRTGSQLTNSGMQIYQFCINPINDITRIPCFNKITQKVKIYIPLGTLMKIIPYLPNNQGFIEFKTYNPYESNNDHNSLASLIEKYDILIIQQDSNKINIDNWISTLIVDVKYYMYCSKQVHEQVSSLDYLSKVPFIGSVHDPDIKMLKLTSHKGYTKAINVNINIKTDFIYVQQLLASYGNGVAMVPKITHDDKLLIPLFPEYFCYSDKMSLLKKVGYNKTINNIEKRLREILKSIY